MFQLQPRIFRRTLRILAVTFTLLLSAFTWTGLERGWRVPSSGCGPRPRREGPIREVRILAFNIAKAFAFTGSGRFASRDDMARRLDGVLDIVRRERIDLAYISEINSECGPRPFDQVDYLVRRGPFHAWASCDNYRFGVPGLRIRSGNALLSRLPLRALAVEQLPGEKAFWNPTNNRRILWCDVRVNGDWLRTASLRNDSFDLSTNLLQARFILRSLDGRPALLAGDFNAEPQDASMQIFREAGFSGRLDGPATFPTHAPARCIDYILAPANWKLIDHRVLECGLSDHFPVVSVFRIPGH